jgi:hypothetical protein
MVVNSVRSWPETDPLGKKLKAYTRAQALPAS